MEDVLAHTAMAMGCLDSDAHFTKANTQLCSLTGYGHTELHGMPLQALLADAAT